MRMLVPNQDAHNVVMGHFIFLNSPICGNLMLPKEGRGGDVFQRSALRWQNPGRGF
jgi:hypothetical protein